VIFMIERMTTLSSRTTGFLSALETARIAVEHPHVGDGEGAAGHFVRGEFAGAGLIGKLFGPGVEFGHGQLVRITDDRHDQSLLQRHRQAQMDATVPPHAPAVS